jgi:hypothetical protein
MTKRIDASSSDENENGNSSEPATKAGAARLLLNTIALPGEAFKEINRRPAWLAPIIIAAVAMMAGNAIYYWRVNPNWEQRVRARIDQHTLTTGQTMTPEQVEKQVAFAKTMGRFFIVLPAVNMLGFCLIVAGFYFVAFGLGFLSAPPYRKMLAVVAWSEAANRVVAAVILIVVLILFDKAKLQSLDTSLSSIVVVNLGALLPSSTSAPIKSLATSMDIFAIWFLVLLSIGFACIAEVRVKKITIWKSGALVFGAWAAWVLTKVGMAAVFGY